MPQRPLRPSALPPGGLVRDPPKAYRVLPTCRGQAGVLEWPGGGCVKLSAVPCLEGQRCSVPDGWPFRNLGSEWTNPAVFKKSRDI